MKKKLDCVHNACYNINIKQEQETNKKGIIKMNLYDISFNFGTQRTSSIAVRSETKAEAIAYAIGKLRKREREAIETITVTEDAGNVYNG
jgi:hypothetical protein